MLNVISGTKGRAQQGHDELDQYRVQVDYYATDFLTVRDMRRQVIALLNGYRSGNLATAANGTPNCAPLPMRRGGLSGSACRPAKSAIAPARRLCRALCRRRDGFWLTEAVTTIG